MSVSICLSMVVLWYMVDFNAAEIRVEPKCSPEEPVCRFYLRISLHWTMMHFVSYGMMMPVTIDENGTYYARKKSCDQLIKLNQTEAEKVIVGDGTVKQVLVFNKQLPGPPIVVYKGQQVIVKVRNDMSGYVTTVHWHGQTMDGTPYMDGVADITQYPIPPKQTFTYRFNATRLGTLWYHTHLGTQRSMGAYGPFVVLPRPQKNPEPQMYKDDMIMVVSDWMHEESRSLHLRLLHDNMLYPYGYDNDTCFPMTTGVDGLQVGMTPFISGIVNGKGRYFPNSGGKAKYPYIPLEAFSVEKKSSAKVKFRLISASMIFAFKVSIDHHDLHVIATDGEDIDPIIVQYIIIHPGERYDFWIEPTDPANIGSYWIRLTTLEYIQDAKLIPAGHTAAILQYKEVKLWNKDPKSVAPICKRENPCKILNCPFQDYPEAFHLQCVNLGSLRSKNKDPVLSPKSEDEFVEIFLNYHFSGVRSLQMFRPNVNGKVFVPAEKPLLLQTTLDPAHSIPCNETLCAEEVCYCTHQIDIPLNKVVQLVIFTAMPELSPHITGTHHTIHLHGHHMEILKVAYPTYDKDTGLFKATNSDIKCKVNDLCNEADWSNSSWRNGNVPDTIQLGAIKKDTLIIPGGGYVVARFRSDNPGFWFMHCHMEVHNQLGMSLVIKEGELEDMPVPSNKRPLLLSTMKYTSKPAHTEQLEESQQSPTLQAESNQANEAERDTAMCSAQERHYLVAIATFAVISFILLTTFIWLTLLQKSGSTKILPPCTVFMGYGENSEMREKEHLLM